MENEVNDYYIQEAIKELVSVLGSKEFVDHKKITSLISSKKIKEAAKVIAAHLGLLIEVNISYVPRGYQSNANDGFQSRHLVKTTGKGGGISGITAQVSIPSDLPLYGSISMVNFPINVRLSKNCAENPAALIGVMAHEFSHIVLYSMRHKEKENEFYTDLTAMILGFAKIMKIGRKVVKTNTSTDYGIFSNTTTTRTETTTYGYLSDDNFSFAFKKIENILNKQKTAKKRLLKKIKHFKKQLDKNKLLFFYFENYFKYLNKNLNQKISQEHGIRISAFHQPGYIDNFQSSISKNEMNLKNSFEFVLSLKEYTAENIEIMQKHAAQLNSANEELTKQHFLLKKDRDVLKKYVGFLYKLKLKFRKLIK